VDGDDFSRATRLGRAVADAVIRSAENELPFDGFTTARLIDHFVDVSGGITSLGPILSILEDVRATPLLISTRIDEACARVNEAVHEQDCGMLDLQLGLVTQSALLRGETDALTIVERFCRAFIERYAIMGRGGLLEIDGPRYIARARELIAPIATTAANALLRRPDAQRLGLARAYHIDENSNLLEVT
jgi:hypothetical protein